MSTSYIPDVDSKLDIIDLSTMNLLSQGAEARVFCGKFLGREAIIKQRFKKTYRHPTLDEKITKQRLISEARMCGRARKLGVRAPTILFVDRVNACIYMEKVPGTSVKDAIREGKISGETLSDVMRQIGRAIAEMHDGGLVHGDLTTSNVMVMNELVMQEINTSEEEEKKKKNKNNIAMIDFGLSYNSFVPEDKAVDLYVLERAILSAHGCDGEGLFSDIIEEYKEQVRWHQGR